VGRAIYVHPLEMPYLTGGSDYLPRDSTMGGAIAQMARLFPYAGYGFGDRVQPLPAGGDILGLENWKPYHTPGHTRGTSRSSARQTARCWRATP
jgi:glyoxylase-like metal-dependent hydrolase (beta-lactamase superfamily II)